MNPAVCPSHLAPPPNRVPPPACPSASSPKCLSLQKVDPRQLQISLTGFLEKNTSLFCKVRRKGRRVGTARHAVARLQDTGKRRRPKACCT